MDIALGVAELAVDGPRIFRLEARSPPLLRIAAPGHLDFHHSLLAQGGGERVVDLWEITKDLQGEGDPLITYRPEPQVVLGVVDVRHRQVQNNLRSC